jgi:L-seryl-tRNA(Ser) seleniumtransferase
VPRTDTVLADPRLVAAVERLGPKPVRDAVTTAQQRARAGELSPGSVPDAAVAALPARTTSLRPVLNATGVVLHTNLGRAPLSGAAREALAVAAGAVDVEFDVATGTRARRGRGTLDALLAAVPDAEAARDGRDRRRLPAAGPHRLDRRAAARGRHHQPHHAARLRRCCRA